MVTTSRVPEHKRPLIVEMKKHMLDAIDRQLARMFGLPDMEPEDFEKLPLPPMELRQMEAGECREAREATMADPAEFQAARLLRLGLPATRVAPMVKRSLYWTRNRAQRFRRIGLVPPNWRERRLCQPDLFAEG